LLFAGTGRYESRLQQLAQGADNIRFLRHVLYGQLRKLYASAGSVTVPSVTFEVAPLVTIEAFKEKTPVIVRRLGGMPEKVVESGGGFVYKTDAELVSAMDQLMESPSLRRVLGWRGYLSYLQNCTIEAHVNAYLDLIRDIAASRRAKVVM
jgi:glycosyltransferase involved in cell wall biosynthesis